MSADKFQSFNLTLKGAVGEELAIVAFVRDYWQITFGHYSFSVLSSLRVYGPDWRVRDGDVGFRDRLCDCINSKLEQALCEEERLVFSLDNGCFIEISLRDEDYSGPEAVNFRDPVTGSFYAF